MIKLCMAILVTLVALTVSLRAEEPTEEIKKRALLLGYVLNGNSMVRPLHAGSIDVSGLLYGDKPIIDRAPELAPHAPPPPERQKK